MNPRARHLPQVAEHITNLLGLPDIVFLQEIQDDSGPRDNGVVSANATLQAIASAIKVASGGVSYDFVDVPPINNMDGGQPGGNIRPAYL